MFSLRLATIVAPANVKVNTTGVPTADATGVRYYACYHNLSRSPQPQSRGCKGPLHDGVLNRLRYIAATANSATTL
jgi:hypothetical protein